MPRGTRRLVSNLIPAFTRRSAARGRPFRCFPLSAFQYMVLAVQNLRVQYGARVLFNDLSFTVEDGERIALAGHNGAGKSTLMKCIAGLNEPDSGSIIKSRHSQVGYLPQEGIHIRGRRLIDEAMSAFAD